MWRKISYLGLFVILVSSFAFGQYVNVLKNGGFESGNPALFKAVGATGATLEWAVDASRRASYSLKISNFINRNRYHRCTLRPTHPRQTMILHELQIKHVILCPHLIPT